MVLIITSQANQGFANKIAAEYPAVQFVSPMKERAVHGAEKVIIIGSYPAVEKRYSGIMPVEVIKPPKEKPNAPDE